MGREIVLTERQEDRLIRFLELCYEAVIVVATIGGVFFLWFTVMALTTLVLS